MPPTKYECGQTDCEGTLIEKKRPCALDSIPDRMSQKKLEYGLNSSIQIYSHCLDILSKVTTHPWYPNGWSMDHFVNTCPKLTDWGRCEWYALFLRIAKPQIYLIIFETQALGIARGLAYIHSKDAIHSDVKSVSRCQVTNAKVRF